MFRNNLKTGWRSLKSQPFFTFLNMAGLAVGMAGVLLIGLYIYDELSYDQMFADSERIYRINGDIKFGGAAQEFAVSPPPLAPTLTSDYGQVELSTRFRVAGSLLIRKTDATSTIKEEQSTFADSTFFDMFGIALLSGDPKTALKEPNTVVLTKTTAEKHFGKEDAVGQSILINNDEVYTVSGVMDNLPKNSFLRNYTVFMAMSGYGDANSGNWVGNNYYTFIKLVPGAKIEDFQDPLQSIVDKYVLPFAQAYMPDLTKENFKAAGNYLNYSAIPLEDIHLTSNRVGEMSVNNSMDNVYILSFIGLFLILLASVNFMNLSTAQSLKRAKEVGIRKTLGSNKMGLVQQFLIESGLISFLSLSLAIVLAFLALPYFNQLAGKTLTIPVANPAFWLVILVATLLLGIISGSYPAFFMSKFVPVKVLKGFGQKNRDGGSIRNGLVVFQFSISIFLIISTLVVFQQLNYIQNKDLGFQKNQLLIIDDVYAAGNKLESFKEEIKQISAVENASLSSFLPTPSVRSDESFYLEGAMQQDQAIQMQDWRVDQDYAATLNLEMVAGRFFDERFLTDSSGTVINESAVDLMGLKPDEAIGKRISEISQSGKPEYFTVLGVVKNFHYESLRDNIGALRFVMGGVPSKLAVKLKSADYTNTLSSIEKAWDKVAPGQPFNYYFMDESFNRIYESEQRLGRIFFTFAVLSIFIACLGLFGLAAFNAEKRTKEIGVRKVMGASVGQIAYRLSHDFLKLVAVAILIALPLGWFAMHRWLEDFSYRIEINWGVLALAAILAILVSIITVSYQAIKAARMNPVKSLKNE